MYPFLAEIRGLLARSDLFSLFNEADREEMIASASMEDFAPGELFLQRGPSDSKGLYLLVSGKMEAFQDTEKEPCSLNFIGPGGILGENTYLGEKEWAVSVKAVEETRVLMIPQKVLDPLVQKLPNSRLFYERLHRQTLSYLKRVNQRASELAKTKTETGMQLSLLVVFLALFSLFLGFLKTRFLPLEQMGASTLGLGLGALLLIRRLREKKISLDFLGLSTMQVTWKKLGEALLMSGVILSLALGAKYALFEFSPDLQKRLLVSIEASYPVGLAGGAPFLLYAIHAFFQELLARGALQGMLFSFSPFKRGRVFFAVLFASFLFAMAYGHYGIAAAATVFSPGLFWGWLYARHQTIFPVWLSHTLVGFVFFSYMI